VNEVIDDITIHWHKTFLNFESWLPVNSHINGLSRNGKYIIIELDKSYLVIHLRMTGQIIIHNSNAFPDQHLRLSIKMKSGNYFNFYDARKFGRIYHVCDPEFVSKKVGIDALSDNLNFSRFYELLKSRKKKIKTFLMDQSIIAGIGNIYADESLFLSKIHPETLTDLISEKKAKMLYENIKTILKAAIKNMGTTISDYKTTGGGFGGFQNKLQVYGRKGLPCFSCGSEIQKIKLNGRGTHFCPSCQPENRS